MRKKHQPKLLRSTSPKRMLPKLTTEMKSLPLLKLSGEDFVFQRVRDLIRAFYHGVKEHMEFGARSLSALWLHVIPGKMEPDRGIRKVLDDGLRGDPLPFIIAVVIVAFQRQTVGAQEVLLGAITALVRHRNIIMVNGPPERLLVSGDDLMRVVAVPLVA